MFKNQKDITQVNVTKVFDQLVEDILSICHIYSFCNADKLHRFLETDTPKNEHITSKLAYNLNINQIESLIAEPDPGVLIPKIEDIRTIVNTLSNEADFDKSLKFKFRIKTLIDTVKTKYVFMLSNRETQEPKLTQSNITYQSSVENSLRLNLHVSIYSNQKTDYLLYKSSMMVSYLQNVVSLREKQMDKTRTYYLREVIELRTELSRYCKLSPLIINPSLLQIESENLDNEERKMLCSLIENEQNTNDRMKKTIVNLKSQLKLEQIRTSIVNPVEMEDPELPKNKQHINGLLEKISQLEGQVAAFVTKTEKETTQESSKEKEDERVREYIKVLKEDLAKKDELMDGFKNELLELTSSYAELKNLNTKLVEDMDFQVGELERKLEVQTAITNEVVEQSKIENKRLLEEIQSIKVPFNATGVVQSLIKPSEMVKEESFMHSQENEYIEEIDALTKLVNTLQNELKIASNISLQQCSINTPTTPITPRQKYAESMENRNNRIDGQTNFNSKNEWLMVRNETFTIKEGAKTTKFSKESLVKNDSNKVSTKNLSRKTSTIENQATTRKTSLHQTDSNKVGGNREPFLFVDTTKFVVQEYKHPHRLGSNLFCREKPVTVPIIIKFRSKSVPNPKLNIKPMHIRYYSTAKLKDNEFPKYLEDYKKKYDLKMKGVVKRWELFATKLLRSKLKKNQLAQKKGSSKFKDEIRALNSGEDGKKMFLRVHDRSLIGLERKKYKIEKFERERRDYLNSMVSGEKYIHSRYGKGRKT